MSIENLKLALQPGGPMAAMAEYRHFCVYELIPSQTRPGKTDKIPCIPRSWKDPAGHLSAEQAFEAAASWNGPHPIGVGYLIWEDDPFFFLDLDQAREGKAWKPHVDELRKMIPKSAFEISSSNTGCHMFGSFEGEIKHAKKYAPLGLELYTSARLAALTGESMIGRASEMLTDGLKKLVEKYFEPGEDVDHVEVDWEDVAHPEWNGIADDDELIQRFINSRATFAQIIGSKATNRELWTQDEQAMIEAFPTTSESPWDRSSADMSMASRMAYWTGNNPVRMLRIMERSALVREKWELRPSYVVRTIEKAIRGCHRFYGGPRELAVLSEEAIEGAWLPADPDYHGETDGKAIAVRMLAGDEKTGKLSKALQAGDLGYVANSALFNSGRSCDIALEVVQTLMPDVEGAAARSAVVSLRGASENFRGRVEKWDRAPSGEPVEVLPLELLRTTRAITGTNDHYRDALALAVEVFQKRLAGFDGAPYWWDGRMWEMAQEGLLRRFTGEGLADGEIKVTNGRIAGTVAVLKDQLPIMGQINPPSVLVFFQNCVLNVVDGKVTAHNQAYRNGYLIGCDYDPEAACPQFEAWLHEIFESDRGRVGLLQEIFGWCLITENLNIQKAVTLVGAPRAGKGTILSLLTGLLGDAAGAFQLADLVEDKVLAGMMNRNVAIDYDAASPDRNSSRQVTGKFKAITANEPIAVRLLYTQQPFQGRLNCKLVLAANSVPTLWDDTGASPNRWVPLVFDKSYLGREDAGLAERLMGELPGIAIWALEGLARLIENRKFTLPQSSLDELAGLVDNASPYDRFLDEMCQFGPEERVTESDVWEAYTKWAIGYGMEPGKRPTVLESIKDTSRARGVRRSKSLRIGERVVRGFYGMDISGAAPPTSSVKQIRGAP